MNPEDIHVGSELILHGKIPCLVIISEGAELFTVAYLDIHQRRCEALVSFLELSPMPAQPAIRKPEPLDVLDRAPA